MPRPVSGHLGRFEKIPPERKARSRVVVAHATISSVSQVPASPSPPSASDLAGAVLAQDACIGLRMLQEVDNNFSRRPPAESILDRLTDSVHMGNVRTCNADVVFHGTTGLSLVEMFLHLANYISVASYFNASVVWSQPDAYNAVWAAYFRNALGLAVPFCRSAGRDDELIHANGWIETLARNHHAYTFHVKSAILRHLWTLWSKSRTTIDDTLTKVGIDINTKFIGIDLPGLELHLKIAEAGQSNTSIVGQIRSLMKKENITVIYAVRRGDEPKDANASAGAATANQSVATHSLSGASLLQKHVGSEAQWLTIGSGYTRLRQGKFQPHSAFSVLTVVEALRRSHVFVGASDSNVSNLVYHLRTPGSISVKFDMAIAAEQLQMQSF